MKAFSQILHHGIHDSQTTANHTPVVSINHIMNSCPVLVSLPEGVVIDDPVIVVFIFEGSKPKFFAFKSFVESVGNEN